MSNNTRGMRNDLRPITNVFRAGRLIIGLFFLLFMGIFILGFIIESLEAPAPESAHPAGKAHHYPGAMWF